MPTLALDVTRLKCAFHAVAPATACNRTGFDEPEPLMRLERVPYFPRQSQFVSPKCQPKVVMSPFSNFKMSPFGNRRGCAERDHYFEQERTGSCTCHSGNDRQAAATARGSAAVEFEHSVDQAPDVSPPWIRSLGPGVRPPREATEQRDSPGAKSGTGLAPFATLSPLTRIAHRFCRRWILGVNKR